MSGNEASEPVERLCRKSFALHPLDHVTPAEADGWGVCDGCGETVNTRAESIPEHKVPTR